MQFSITALHGKKHTCVTMQKGLHKRTNIVIFPWKQGLTQCRDTTKPEHIQSKFKGIFGHIRASVQPYYLSLAVTQYFTAKYSGESPPAPSSNTSSIGKFFPKRSWDSRLRSCGFLTFRLRPIRFSRLPGLSGAPRLSRQTGIRD